MKNIFPFFFIILLISFQSCKNNKPQPTNLEENTTESIVITEDLDTVNANDTLQTKDVVSEEIKEDIIAEEVAKPIEKEVEKVTEKVNKTTTTIIKEESDIKVVVEEKVEETKPIAHDVVEKVVEETVVQTKPIEEVVKKEVRTVTEPVVEKVTEEAVVESNTWVVPSKYKKMTNPEDASKENLSIGKNLYSKHCKSCHGKEGYGDGHKADEIEGDLGDFTSNKFKAQTDGALFYKSYIGRDDMPNYEKKMSEEDAWLVVHYIRTL